MSPFVMVAPMSVAVAQPVVMTSSQQCADERNHRTVGDTVVTCGPDHYVVADRPDRAPTLFISPGGDCRDAAGNHLADLMSLGVRTWGNDPTGSATLLTGAYALDGEVGARLLRALPPALVLPQAEWNSPIAALLAGEIGRDEPG